MKRAFCGRGLALLLALACAALCLAACQKEAAPLGVSLAPAAQNVAVPEGPQVPSAPRREINFEDFKAVNEDIIAWLEVPGTVIDYPLVRGVDNAFYLDHNEGKAYSQYGAIFTDMSNPDDFSAPLMVAYGHYTPEETHFTQLHRYEDPAYFAENREARISVRRSETFYWITKTAKCRLLPR